MTYRFADIQCLNLIQLSIFEFGEDVTNISFKPKLHVFKKKTPSYIHISIFLPKDCDLSFTKSTLPHATKFT